MPKTPKSKDNSFNVSSIASVDGDGKPKRAFQSITICRQYEEY